MASTGTGVVIGSHSVKVVQAQRKAGILKLTRVGNAKLDAATAGRPFDAAKIDRLAAKMREAEPRSGDALLGLTGRDLIVRYTHVPPVPDWRLGMLMKFEIEEVSEQSGGEVSADWVSLDLPESAASDKTVLVALAKNATLQPRIDALAGANLRLRGACPNAIAAYHAFVSTAHYEPGEATLLMHIGAENTDIAIQRDGLLLFARNVSGGGGLFTEAIMNQFGAPYARAEKMKFQKVDVTPRGNVKYEDALSEKVSNAVLGVTGQFVSMVHSSVMFCKAQTKLKELSVDRVVLAGGGANLKGLREYMESNLGITTVIFDPSNAVDLSALPPEQVQIFEKDPSGLTVAIGLASLALERSGAPVEIMPEEYRKRREFMEKGVWMLGAAAVAAVLIIVLFAVSGRDHGEITRQEAELAARRVEVGNAGSELRSLEERLQTAEARWGAIRGEGLAGPCLSQALAWMKAVILEEGEGFRDIHITSMSCKYGSKAVSPRQWYRRWDPEKPAARSSGSRGSRGKKAVRGVIVEFTIRISEMASEEGDTIHSKFTTRLRQLVREREKDLLIGEMELLADELGLDEEIQKKIRKALRSDEEIRDDRIVEALRQVEAYLPRILCADVSDLEGKQFHLSVVFGYQGSQGRE